MAEWNYFKNQQLQDQYNKNGYVIIEDFADIPTIDLLELFFDAHMPPSQKPFYVSNWCNDYKINQTIDVTIRSNLQKQIDHYLHQHRVIIGLMFSKNPTKDSAYYVHRDWALVDERQYSSLHFWLPLMDIDDTNGNLFVYEGSHKVGPIVRGSPSLNFPAEGFFHKMKDKFGKKDIYLKKGSVLIFDHRLKHGSRANHSGSIRKVVGLSIIPDEAQLIHFHQHQNGKIEKYKVEDEFYLNYNLIDQPSAENSLGYVTDEYFK
jgi:ectoine hydroxylase-related dioxygenase (phytanoyl-CoA dioxygenase family)